MQDRKVLRGKKYISISAHACAFKFVIDPRICFLFVIDLRNSGLPKEEIKLLQNSGNKFSMHSLLRFYLLIKLQGKVRLMDIGDLP